jgi:hypothetical protein
MDDGVEGERFGNCRAWASSRVGEAGAVLELTMQPRRMLDALRVSEVIANSVQISCDARLRLDIENLQMNVLVHGVACSAPGVLGVDIWAEKGQVRMARVPRTEWEANAVVGRCGSDRPDGRASATSAARRGLTGEGQSGSVGDPAHLVPGAVRIFPPLRSCAA